MGHPLDIAGRRFGRLVAERRAFDLHRGRGVLWHCRCDCGGAAVVLTSRLGSGNVRSCGCLLAEWRRAATRRFNESGIISGLAGRRFGRLIVIGLHVGRHARRAWDCLCDCGNPVVVRANPLLSGNTRSCGCLSREMSSGRLSALKAKRQLDKLEDFFRERSIDADATTRGAEPA